MREALVLGRLLHRTVILPDPHVHKVKSGGGGAPTASANGQPTELPLDFMVDVPRLQASQPVHLLRHWLGSGRDSKVDASVRICASEGCLSSTEGDAVLFDAAGQAPTMLRWGRDGICFAEGWKAKAEELRPFRMVGVLTYRDVVPHVAAAADSPGDGCLSVFHDVQSNLHRSEQVRAAADLFMRVHLGGDDGAFAAVHVQPRPEKCLAAWRSRPFDVAHAGQACGDNGLHSRLAQTVHEQLAAHKLARVLIICHPEILDPVKALLAAPGQLPSSGALAAQYLSLDLLEVYSGWRLASAQAAVNAELAEAARLFLGTPQTALTAAIEQGRAAKGRGRDTTVMLPQGV